MKIIDALRAIDALKPNGFDDADKIRWLSELDGRIKIEVIDTHEGGDAVTFEGYGEETSTDTVMLVPAPFEDIYIKWLESKIDYANAEYGKYNNSSIAFNNVFTAFSKYYHSKNMPKRTTLKFF